MAGKIRTVIVRLADGLIWLLTGCFFLWSVGAIYWLEYLPRWLALAIAIVYATATLILVIRGRFSWKSRSLVAVSMLLVYLATLPIRPVNQRNWADDHAKIADVSIDDGLVTIRNFRFCHYRSALDYDARFLTKRFPLSHIDSVWLIVQKFSAGEGIAHLFLSFGLTSGNDPEFFSVSVEIRREQGESYGPIRGLYRNYEIAHVIGDERDLIGVRTVHRPSDRVYLYRVNATPQQAQQLFRNFAERIGQLRQQPEFYHTLLNNCANGITSLTYQLTPEPINWLDPRIVFPGHADRFAFEQGLIGERDSGQQFKDLQSRSRIDTKAIAAGITENFSRDIRHQ